MSRVVVGLSGGVDSSVAAHLLLEQGHEVIGVFMQNWHDETVVINNECPWVDDSNDALLVAEKLGIPFQVVDLSEEYKNRIVDYMFAEYAVGRTPNPDVLCNREIKFDVFLKVAERLGADFVATGHYCQKDSVEINGEIVYRLISGADKNKDQSYFLCQINQQQLSKALFPIGHLQKSEVRKIAAKQDLITADKKDSQGLCFVGKISLPEFLQQKLEPIDGDVIRISEKVIPAQLFKNRKGLTTEELAQVSQSFKFSPDQGTLVGKHKGAHFFTVGQRKGLGIGGSKEPLFVLSTDVEKNIIYVGEGENHPGLYRYGLAMNRNEINWLRDDLRIQNGKSMEVKARIRYRQALQDAILHFSGNKYFLTFNESQRGITPGQFSAWYLDNELVGSGVIHQ